MNMWILTGILMVLSLSFLAQAHANTQSEHGYKEIHTDQLRDWYDQGTKMIVIDARSKEYFDGRILPSALWLPFNASEEDVEATIPFKDDLIVVYCWSPACPAGRLLAERLTAAGYTNIYKYPEGLQEWIQRGFPTHKI